MSGITFIFIILSFVYIINGNSKLTVYIQTILRMKLNYKTSDKKSTSKITKINSTKTEKIKNNMNKRNNVKSSLKNVNKKFKGKIIRKQNDNKNKLILNKKSKTNPQQKRKKNKNVPPKKILNKNHRTSFENLIKLSRNKKENVKETIFPSLRDNKKKYT